MLFRSEHTAGVHASRKAKKRKVPKSGAVWKMSAEEATLAKKPHYNGYACGHGVHGDVKYNRTKQKAQTRKILDEMGASRGSLLFLWAQFGLSLSWAFVE